MLPHHKIFFDILQELPDSTPLDREFRIINC